MRLKEAMTHTLVLTMPNFTRPFFVMVINASGQGLGEVLMQHNHPTTFESRKSKPM